MSEGVNAQEAMNRELEKMEKFMRSGSWLQVTSSEKEQFQRIRLAEEQSSSSKFDLTGDVRKLI